MKGLILRVATLLLRLSENKSRAGWLMIPLFVGLAVVFLFNVEPAVATPGDATSTTLTFIEWASLNLAQLIVQFAQIIGHIMVALIDMVGIPIMQYNGFATSKIIGYGWSLVRDIMNIGFVVVALIIALRTIFFGASFEWQKHLVRLLVYAILINFSRTFCGLMIDFGQVIMMTFVNAIKDIAGGNLIQLFGLTHILNFSPEQISALSEAEQGLQSFNYLGSSVAALVLMSVAFLTLLTFMVLLVYRIVLLWILVVLSPIAFFFGGAKEVLGGNIKPYSEWWAQFTAAVAIGPILIFFMWLALAVAGSGNIASVEDFDVEAMPSEGKFMMSTFPLEVFQMDRLVSFVVGIGLLFAGFDVAMRMSSALPGSMKKLIGPGMAAGIARRAAVASTRVGRAGLRTGWGGLRAGVGAGLGLGLGAGRKVVGGGAKLAVKAGGAALGAGWDLAKTNIKVPTGKDPVRLGDVKGEMGKGVGKLGAGLQEAITGEGDSPFRKFVGGLVGGSLEAGGIAVSGAELAKQQKGFNTSQGKVKNYDTDQLQRIAARETFLNEDQLADTQAARFELETQFRHRKGMSSEELQENRDRFVNDGGKDLIKGDTTKQKAMLESGLSRLDMFKGEASDKGSDFSKALLGLEPKDLMKMDSQALDDERVQNHLKNTTHGFDRKTGEDISVWDKMKKTGREANKQKIAEIEGEGLEPEAQMSALMAQHGQEQEVMTQEKASADPGEERAEVEQAEVEMRIHHSGQVKAFFKKNPKQIDKVTKSDLKANDGALSQGLALGGSSKELEAIGREESKKAEFVEQNSPEKMDEKGYTGDEKAQATASTMVVKGEVDVEDDADGQAALGSMLEHHTEKVGELVGKLRDTDDAKYKKAQKAMAKGITSSVAEGVVTKLDKAMKGGASAAEIKALQDSLREVKTAMQVNKGDLGENRKILTYLKKHSRKFGKA